MRLDLRLTDHRTGIWAFVEPGLLEVGRECLLPLAHRFGVLRFRAQQQIHRAGDRGRVDAAGQARPDRHIASESQSNRVDEQRADGFGCIGRRIARLERPVPANANPVSVERERMSGWQLLDPDEERVGGVAGVSLLDVFTNDAEIRLEPRRRIGAERLRLRCEYEARTVPAEVERLHAEAVTRAKNRTPTAVPERECPHAVEAFDALLAPLFVSAQDHLGVGRAPKPVAECFELAAQLTVVVDLAVVHELECTVVACERLHPGIAQIDDREPSESQRDAGFVRVEPVTVRSAMIELARHGGGRLAFRRTAERHDSRDSAHRARL